MSEALRARAAALPLSDLVDADRERRVLAGLRRLSGTGSVAGWARTAQAAAGDAAAVHAAVRASGPGDVVVVDFGGATAPSGIGALVAAEAQRRGVVAVVLWGPARDAAALRSLSMSVFATGLQPIPGVHRDGGAHGVELRLDGVAIRPGDLVVADDDGVGAFAPADVERVVAAAERSARLDAEMATAIAAGSCLWDLPQLRGYIDAVDSAAATGSQGRGF